MMVRTVLRYLNNLARESGDDPTLQWELATAYQRIGDVQGYGLRPNLGQRTEALESHRKALAIAEQLVTKGGDPKVQRLLAVAHDRVGFLRIGVIMDGDRPRIEPGIEQYDKSIEVLERLNRASPGDPENSRLLIMVYGHRGDAELLRGRTVEAAANWLRTLEVAKEWATRNPSDAARIALGNAHRRVSAATQHTGDLRAAWEHAKEAIAIHEPLALSQPSSTAWQRELLNSYERLSYVAGRPELMNLGDTETARMYNRKVVAIAEALHSADPNNRMASSDLIIAKRTTCNYLPDDDAALVVRVCEESKAISERLGAGNVELQFSMAWRLAPALAKLGRRAEALSLMDSAVKITADAVDKWPWRTDMRLQLLRVHVHFGTMLVGLGNSVEALKHYQSALAIGQGMLTAGEQPPVVWRDVAECYRTLGRFYERSDLEQAKRWYQKDLDIWTEWPRHFPSSQMDQRRRDEAAGNVARCSTFAPS